MNEKRLRETEVSSTTSSPASKVAKMSSPEDDVLLLIQKVTSSDIESTMKNEVLHAFSILISEINHLRKNDSLYNQVISSNQKLLHSKEETIASNEKVIASKEETIAVLYSKNEFTHHLLQTIKGPELREHKRSIVISNLPESSKVTTSEKIQDDTKLIQDLINDIDAYASVTTCYRMGSTGENKKRLVKVQLQTSAQAKEVLIHAKYIRNSQRFKDMHISIRRSMTDEERAIDQQHMNRLRQRISELSCSNPTTKYVIYAGKICTKNIDNSRPTPVDDPLNIISSGANATPLNPNRFQPMEQT